MTNNIFFDFSIKIDTPENTEIEFELAGIGNRLLALMIDYLIIGIFFFIFFILLGILATMSPEFLKSSLTALYIISTSLLFYFSYFFIFEWLWNGQTPGKKTLEIRVIKNDGYNIGFWESFLRNLLRIIDLTLYIGVFSILMTKTEKRLGDLAVGTIVIRERSINKSFILPIDPSSTGEISGEYYFDVYKLTPLDYSLINSYICRSKTFPLYAKKLLLTSFMKYLGHKIPSINVHENNKPSIETMETVIQSLYTAYTQRAE